MINKVLGLLGISAKAGKIIAGSEIVIENIKKRKVKLVILAKDASEKTKKNIKLYCEESNTQVIEFGEIEKNSRAIGKENKAIIGVLDNNLAIAILKKISGGENFG